MIDHGTKCNAQPCTCHPKMGDVVEAEGLQHLAEQPAWCTTCHPAHNHRVRGLHGRDCPACAHYMDTGQWIPVADSVDPTYTGGKEPPWPVDHWAGN